jgi:hypothetical protein
MKNINVTIMAGLLAVAISLSGVSCKKKEQVAAPPPPSPEQQAAIEEAKKGVEEARKIDVAEVNGVEITMFELVREMNRIAPKYIKENEKTAPGTTEKVRKEALDNLIFAELAVQEAVKQGITVTPERIDEVIQLMKKQTGSAKAYQEYLSGLGITEDQLRKRIERSHQLELITGKEIYQKIKLDDKDVRAEYEKNKNAFKDGSGKQMSYEEAAPVIKRKLMAELGAEMKKAWEKTLRKNAKIVIAKDGGK